VAKAKKDK